MEEINSQDQTGIFRSRFCDQIDQVLGVIKEEQSRAEESVIEPQLSDHIELASLNTKHDSYLLTKDGRYLVFLTFDEAVKYDIELRKIVVRIELKPILFPMLKKMTERHRNLQISACGNRILAIISETKSRSYKCYALIFKIDSQDTPEMIDEEQKFAYWAIEPPSMKADGTKQFRGNKEFLRGGQLLHNTSYQQKFSDRPETADRDIKWYLGTDWNKYLFYECSKRSQIIRDGQTEHFSIKTIKRFDLGRQTTREFFQPQNQRDYDFNCIPVYSIRSLIIFEWERLQPWNYIIRLIDMDNFKVTQKLTNINEVYNDTFAHILKIDKQNFYSKELYFIGGERHKTVFLQYGKVLITIDLERRKTLSFDSQNLARLRRNNYGILESIFQGKKIEDTRKVICMCKSSDQDTIQEECETKTQSLKKWVSLENFSNKDNTGTVKIWEYKEIIKTTEELDIEESLQPKKHLLYVISFNDNDRENREMKFYSLVNNQQMKFSITALNQPKMLNQRLERQKICQVLLTKHDIANKSVELFPIKIISEVEYHMLNEVKVDLRKGYVILQFHSYQINTNDPSTVSYKYFLYSTDTDKLVVVEPKISPDKNDIENSTRFQVCGNYFMICSKKWILRHHLVN